MAEHRQKSEQDADYWWMEYYRMVKCCGCDHVSFDREVLEESNVEYDQDGIETITPIHYSYPVPEGKMKCVEYTWNFPSEVYPIYNETITALNEKCHRLAAVGFRAIIEAICNNKNIKAKNLEAKINGLKKAGLITEADRNRLHSVRFLGNDAAHQMIGPPMESLLLVLEIVNGLLTNLYIIEDKLYGKLECPIKDINDFMKLLDQGLASRSVGEVDIMRKLLPVNRRLIREDLKRFEMELQQKINSGEYSKLSLCPPPQNGQNQQYKIVQM